MMFKRSFVGLVLGQILNWAPLASRQWRADHGQNARGTHKTRIGWVRAIGLATAVVAAAVLQAPAAADFDETTTDQAIEQAIEHARSQDKALGDEVEADLAPLKQEAAEAGKGLEAEGHAANTSPLEWKSDLALWTGVVFVVLMLVLWKFAWGPIADGLAKREKGVASQIAEAHQANQDAQTRLADYQRKLDTAAEDVRRMLADARRDAEQSGRQIVEASRDEAKAEQQKALAEIDQATADALAELAARSTRLAVELAGKIVKAELRPADHAALVQQAVKAFTKPSEN